MSNFENHQLLTPELVRQLRDKLFEEAPRPHWVAALEILNLDPEGGDEIESFQAVIFVKSRAQNAKMRMNLYCAAVAYEIARLGHSVSAASNGKGNQYIKVSFKGGQHDRVSLRRVLANPDMDEQCSAFWYDDDYSPEDVALSHSDHPVKDARAIAYQHVERLAREREAAETLPVGFDVKAYLGNILRLFVEIDRIVRPLRLAAE